jgi:predicted phage terminase large subunit-like protein
MERLEKIKMLKLLRQKERRKSESSLIEFYKASWHVLEPSTERLDNWHLEYLSEYLEIAALRIPAEYGPHAGKIARNILANIPPRYSKSRLVTVCFPVWCWIQESSKSHIAGPGLRAACWSYSDKLSTKHSVERRLLIQSAWFLGNWRHFKLTSDQNVKTEFENGARGHMLATSIGGTSTGKGGNLLIVDDPQDPKRAHSDAMRYAGIEFYKSSVQTRMDDKKRGIKIVVMQRLHDEDLSGWLLKHQPGKWIHIKIPGVIDETGEAMEFVFPRSGRVVKMKPGDFLWEEREGKEEMDEQRTGLGSAGFAGQYKQDPAPKEGYIIKKDWIRYWHYLPSGPGRQWVQIPDRFDKKITSWDLSMKDKWQAKSKDGPDHTAAWAMGKRGSDVFLVDRLLEILEFVQTKRDFEDFAKKHPDAIQHVIEDKASGPALQSELKSIVGSLFMFEPRGSKEERMETVSPQFEAGNVFLPHPSMKGFEWVDEFVERLCKFPNISVKDDMDALSQGLIHLKHRATMFDYQ